MKMKKSIWPEEIPQTTRIYWTKAPDQFAFECVLWCRSNSIRATSESSQASFTWTLAWLYSLESDVSQSSLMRPLAAAHFRSKRSNSAVSCSQVKQSMIVNDNTAPLAHSAAI
jgi:hypothetical protein